MKIINVPISRRYLRAASVYRRCAGRLGLDFSREALLAQYQHETHGKPLAQSSVPNGYAVGKWMLNATISMWRESVKQGEFCKAELISPLSRWYALPALANVPAGIIHEHRMGS